MNEREIILIIDDKSLTCLAGNPFGVQTYKKSTNIKYVSGEHIVFVFPNQIKRISASFVQGLVKEIAETVGRAKVSKYVIAESINQNVVDKFNNAIENWL